MVDNPPARTAFEPSWSRRYPPLVSVLVAILLAVFMLPSALTLPQSNPTQTMEYAPVPPTDKDNPPPVGDLNSLSLGSSGSLAGDGPGGGGGAGRGVPGGTPLGTGTIPRQKLCVGSPPRQTEDPLSPPCVSSFQGDNFGATYNGVSKTELQILFYFDGGYTLPSTSQGSETYPPNTYWDLFKPPTSSDPFPVRMLRIWQRYFNYRYQTYGRVAHFHVYFSSGSGSPEARRADAAANYARIHPFAVLPYPTSGNEDSYLDAMAARGVLNFGAFIGRDAKFFQQYPGLVWGFLPSLEYQASQFSTYVCRKVVNRPVSFSGNPLDQGKPRVLGMLSTDASSLGSKVRFAALVKKQIEACGGHFKVERTFSNTGYAVSDDSSSRPRAQQNMAAFQQGGVTTIIWPQGFETDHSAAGARINYRPEWVVAGDTSLDGMQPNFYQDQSAWAHAWVVSNQPRLLSYRDDWCYRNLFLTDPGANEKDSKLECQIYEWYQDMRQLFTGIQVAGPRLTPSSLDTGFHAIPAIASRDPSVPSCFYLPGDYTCVKDAIPGWWDPAGRGPDQSNPGCWRIPEDGKRYIGNSWPSEDVAARKKATDACNSFGGFFFITSDRPS